MTKGPDEMYCESCGETIKQHAEVCPNCGVRPGSGGSSSGLEDERFCQSCGESVKANAEICPNCGVRPASGGSSGALAAATGGGSNDTLYYVGWTFGILFILAGLGTFGDGNVVVSFVQGVFYIAIGALLLPPTRERLDKEYPVTSFGRVRSVDETTITNADDPCSACYGPIDDGVIRSYSEQFVSFGVPLYTVEEGRNQYCRACANGEPAVATGDPSVETA
jgi:RNA polymerase subunit RPABC4/transcription elongation factor Spt4